MSVGLKAPVLHDVSPMGESPLSLSGLVLWRLHQRANPMEQLCCTVRDSEGEFDLVVRNPVTAAIALAEPHPHLRSLLDRAKRVRRQLQAEGWNLVNSEVVPLARIERTHVDSCVSRE